MIKLSQVCDTNGPVIVGLAIFTKSTILGVMLLLLMENST